MPSLRGRPVLVLSVLAILPVASACGSSGRSAGDAASAGQSTGRSTQQASASRATRPLQFSAVDDVTPGACPTHDASTVEDKKAGSCLHLGKPHMTVTSVQSATVISEPQVGVTVVLRPDDAGRLKSLTTTLSKRSSPQNELAVVVGSSEDRHLLTAPEVRGPIAGASMQIVGGFTKKSATQLVHDLSS